MARSFSGKDGPEFRIVDGQSNIATCHYPRLMPGDLGASITQSLDMVQPDVGDNGKLPVETLHKVKSPAHAGLHDAPVNLPPAEGLVGECEGGHTVN
jgi:hypothetical protein